jgi:ferrous iron transport protein A
MNTLLKNLAQLKIGEKAIISSFSDNHIALRLLEMGCTPGEVIEIDRIAPLGDPIAVLVSGYLLSLRKVDAATIMVSSLVVNI